MTDREKGEVFDFRAYTKRESKAISPIAVERIEHRVSFRFIRDCDGKVFDIDLILDEKRKEDLRLILAMEDVIYESLPEEGD